MRELTIVAGGLHCTTVAVARIGEAFLLFGRRSSPAACVRR